MAVYFELDLKKCSACGACAVACMDQNDIDVRKGERPFRQVFRSEEPSEEGGKRACQSSISRVCSPGL